ncbi:MAG TPA: cyclic peptide export ABC transporter [Thermoanaerobaculia bacterium]|jgi:putative ATP-binding cassette transporter|nr:cyclic peptide export ABC transporter [Thermoanaerobaculia bacterium]
MSDLLRILGFLLRVSRGVPRSRALFSVVIVAGVLAGLCHTALIAAVNTALNGGASAGALVLTFLALCLVLPLTRLASNLALMRLSQRTLQELTLQLSDSILRAPLRRIEELGPARLLSTFTDDISKISNGLINIPLLAMHLAIVIGCLIYLGWLSLIGLGVLVGFMIVGLLTYQLPLRRAFHYFRRSRLAWDGIFRQIRALTEGTKELKLHRERRQAFLSENLRPSIDSVQRNDFIGNSFAALGNSLGQILFFVVIATMLFAVPRFHGLERATLSGFALTILYMMTPMEVLVNLLPNLGRVQIAARRVEELGLSLTQRQGEPDAIVTVQEQRWGLLEAVGVTHTYSSEADEAETFTLGPIDLAIRPGELIFIVGGNGSGKTTLAKLLTGLYMPETGELRVDGVPVTMENRDAYRQRFSAVFNDFFLFDSLLGLAAPELDSRARGYLAELHLDKKVKVQEGVLSTLNLSQGQRKRLALLTAYLEDRPIYLFDEWAADQDPQFKEVFYYKLLPELRERGKTLLVISHDDRYYHVADRIIKLNYGKIEFDGVPTGLGIEGIALPQGHARSLAGELAANA